MIFFLIFLFHTAFFAKKTGKNGKEGIKKVRPGKERTFENNSLG